MNVLFEETKARLATKDEEIVAKEEELVDARDELANIKIVKEGAIRDLRLSLRESSAKRIEETLESDKKSSKIQKLEENKELRKKTKRSKRDKMTI